MPNVAIMTSAPFAIMATSTSYVTVFIVLQLQVVSVSFLKLVVKVKKSPSVASSLELASFAVSIGNGKIKTVGMAEEARSRRSKIGPLQAHDLPRTWYGTMARKIYIVSVSRVWLI